MQGKIKRAMVLAAGYGLRLRPITDKVPKPLVPVGGKPMIEYALDKLRSYGSEEVVINVSHLKEQLLAYVPGVQGLAVRVSEETEPLETGGGLKKALPLLGNEPFFTINSDIIWTDPEEVRPGARTDSAPSTALERLTAHWDETKMDVLLLVQSRAKAVGYDKGEDHLFIQPENTIGWDDREAPYIIAGVGILHPRVLAATPEGKFSIKLVWQAALRSSRLFCLPHLGRWFQTGKLEDIQKVEVELGFREPGRKMPA